MSGRVLETPRLYLRRIQDDDFSSIREILQDADVMYAWGHGFSDDEVRDWMDENLMRYGRDGYGYWAVIEKTSEDLVGVCGLISEEAEGEDHMGLGYIFGKRYWKRGYAFESARACAEYAFDHLESEEITAQIRPDNMSSRRLAEKLGMTEDRPFMKEYRRMKIPHILYRLRK